MSVAAASKPMIFGVGLSRTGTSSLTAALEAMGIATIHNDRAFTPHLHDEHGGHSYNFTHHFENFYDRKGAVVDIPTAAYYKELLSRNEWNDNGNDRAQSWRPSRTSCARSCS